MSAYPDHSTIIYPSSVLGQGLMRVLLLLGQLICTVRAEYKWDTSGAMSDVYNTALSRWIFNSDFDTFFLVLSPSVFNDEQARVLVLSGDNGTNLKRLSLFDKLANNLAFLMGSCCRSPTHLVIGNAADLITFKPSFDPYFYRYRLTKSGSTFAFSAYDANNQPVHYQGPG